MKHGAEMTEDELRMDEILQKVADDIYADGQIGFKMMREDWEEIKPVLKDVIDKCYGIHNDITPYLRLQRLIENYERSGLIL